MSKQYKMAEKTYKTTRCQTKQKINIERECLHLIPSILIPPHSVNMERCGENLMNIFMIIYQQQQQILKWLTMKSMCIRI